MALRDTSVSVATRSSINQSINQSFICPSNTRELQRARPDCPTMTHHTGNDTVCEIRSLAKLSEWKGEKEEEGESAQRNKPLVYRSVNDISSRLQW